MLHHRLNWHRSSTPQAGVWYYADGRKYAGAFKDGLFDGEGTLYAAEQDSGGGATTRAVLSGPGQWNRGVYDDSKERAEREELQAQSERRAKELQAAVDAVNAGAWAACPLAFGGNGEGGDLAAWELGGTHHLRVLWGGTRARQCAKPARPSKHLDLGLNNKPPPRARCGVLPGTSSPTGTEEWAPSDHDAKIKTCAQNSSLLFPHWGLFFWFINLINLVHTHAPLYVGARRSTWSRGTRVAQGCAAFLFLQTAWPWCVTTVTQQVLWRDDHQDRL